MLDLKNFTKIILVTGLPFASENKASSGPREEVFVTLNP